MCNDFSLQLAAFQRKRGKKKKSGSDAIPATEGTSKGHGLLGDSSSLIDPSDLGFTSEGSLSIDEVIKKRL